mgnify:FL=1
MSGYFIYASLHQGRPALEIVDADSRQVCLQWEYGHSASQQTLPERDNPAVDELSESEIQRLFRRLLLLSCRQSLHGQDEPEQGS